MDLESLIFDSQHHPLLNQIDYVCHNMSSLKDHLGAGNKATILWDVLPGWKAYEFGEDEDDRVEDGVGGG